MRALTLLAFAIAEISSFGRTATERSPLRPSLKMLEYPKDSNGVRLLMDQKDAIKYCADQGNHLPSARDFAEFAKQRGAVGIVDSCQSKKECYTWVVQNADGNIDTISCQFEGYEGEPYDMKSDENGDFFLWSSSIQTKERNVNYKEKMAYYFDTSAGMIYNTPANIPGYPSQMRPGIHALPFRCAAGPVL